MELQSINIKIPVDGDLSVDSAEFMGLFQRWVKEQHREELLIDMADYRHVPNGPGVLCVGLEADYAMDQRDGQWGLLYNRKASVTGSNADRLGQALGSAAAACEKLESEVPGLKFNRAAFECVINDRIVAVNTAQAWDVFKPELEGFLKSIGAEAVSIARSSEDRRSRLGAKVTLTAPLDFSSLPKGSAV